MLNQNDVESRLDEDDTKMDGKISNSYIHTYKRRWREEVIEIKTKMSLTYDNKGYK